jgi:inorganic pyrophosphatase
MKNLKAFTGTGKTINVIVETPKGSTNKYIYDEEHDCLKLKKVMPTGTLFPYDFGMIPQTKGEDGQALDVLILMDHPAFPGLMVECYVIGIIEAKQKDETSKSYFRNDRLIAVATQSVIYKHIESIDDVPEKQIDEIVRFFEYYNEMQGRKFKFLGIKDANAAMKLIKKNIASK